MRIKVGITLRKAQYEWIKKKGLMISRYIQDKIEQDMKKELLEKEYLPEF